MLQEHRVIVFLYETAATVCYTYEPMPSLHDALPISLGQWRRVLAVNLDGRFRCAREAVREFLRRGPQPEISAATGKIICMSSVHQTIPWAFEVNYAASKGGVSLLMQSLAQELAPAHIRVNAIADRKSTRLNSSH